MSDGLLYVGFLFMIGGTFLAVICIPAAEFDPRALFWARVGVADLIAGLVITFIAMATLQ